MTHPKQLYNPLLFSRAKVGNESGWARWVVEPFGVLA